MTKSTEPNHVFVDMAPPPTWLQRRGRHPFTEKVMAMEVNAGRALIFDRQDETLPRISALCGAAIRCAMRHGKGKEFMARYVTHAGKETCAVWRVK
jgi:hypothetical protein